MSGAVVTFVDEGLGHSSHVVDLGDGGVLVLDPARLPTEQREAARRTGTTIAFTADTHTHADYLSGSPDLAVDGATFLAPAGARLLHPHEPVNDGDRVRVGRLQLEAIATPGHTPDHLAYLLLGPDGRPVALFSGGSLMVGTVGRTDLLGPEHSEALARQLHRALHERILTLPDDLPVYPTHGEGSFCAAPAGGSRVTTIGRERATNPLLQAGSEDEFVDHLLDGLGSYPAYFRRLPELNRIGVAHHAAPPSLDRLDPAGVEGVVAVAGALVVDARPARAFAAGHVPGSLSVALRPAFASWLGWLVDPLTPLVFVVDPDQDEADLVRQCLVVGIERFAGVLDGGTEAWIASGRSLETLALVAPTDIGGRAVVDVRQAAEFHAGHVPGALHRELGSLPAASLPTEPAVVMCAKGDRATTGASLLARRGLAVTGVVDGGFTAWAEMPGAVAATGP
ncbi:MAG: MBL fold metallo-hydrolase [Actinobacteria bacterium]|nr:MBL fold metallo-hydrolase [Actinomycetota bacterium]